MIDIGKDQSGKRKQKRFSGFKTKKDAESACIQKIATSNISRPSSLCDITLESYLSMWLETYKKPKIAFNTYKGYRTNIYNHIIPRIGYIKLCKLESFDIQNMYNQIHRNDNNPDGFLSSQSVYYIHSTLRKALKDALKLKYIPYNPTDFVNPPKVEKYIAKFLGLKEINILLDEVKNTDIYLPTLLAVGLGLRRGEVLGLKYSDIDFDNNTVSINRTYTAIKGGYILSDPKTVKSKRTLVASRQIMDALKERYELFMLEKKLFGDSYNKEGFINTNDRGVIMHSSIWDEELKIHLKKANLPLIRIHDLRHSNASLMIKSGVSMKVASERLGHSKISTTMDIYTHVDLEQQIDAAKRLENLLN